MGNCGEWETEDSACCVYTIEINIFSKTARPPPRPRKINNNPRTRTTLSHSTYEQGFLRDSYKMGQEQLMQYIVKRISLFSVCIVICMSVIVSVFSQEDTLVLQSDTPNKRILIAKGNSGLEYHVAERVKKRFEENGYAVDSIKLKHFTAQNTERYDAILVMNALKRGAVSRKVQQVISEMSEKENSDMQPYLFIATVSGDDWSQKETTVDATTSASSEINAEKIAQKLLDRLERMLIPD